MLAWIDAEARFAAKAYRLPPEEQEELRQSLSLRVLRSFSRFDPNHGAATLKTWVRQQASWGVADYWRERLRRERRETSVDDEYFAPVEGSEPSPETAVYCRELGDALTSCIDKLTPTQRERFRAAEAGEPQKSIASRMGISLDTLKESLSRARVALRLCLQLAGFAPARDECAPPSGRSATV